MSAKPVWMETWTRRHAHDVTDCTGQTIDGETVGLESYPLEGFDGRQNAAATLAAAAPALVRALLAVEWTADGGDWGPCCGVCGELKPTSDYGSDTWPTGLHLTTCQLDAALSAAGFPDQKSRHEARRMMAERKL